MIRGSACRISSRTTLTASFFEVSSVANECRKACHPICCVSFALVAAGRNAESNQIGERPSVAADAKTQSFSPGYGVGSTSSRFEPAARDGADSYRPVRLSDMSIIAIRRMHCGCDCENWPGAGFDRISQTDGIGTMILSCQPTSSASRATGPGPLLIMARECCPETIPVNSHTLC